jgi:hypothetical protein
MADFEDGACMGGLDASGWAVFRLDHACRGGRRVGLWAGNTRVNPGNTPVVAEYVTAMVKGGANGFALKAADASSKALATKYDGPRPPGYQPMKKQGAIILGIGGDNSNSAVGTFYEGAITAGYSTDDADDAVQANIAAAGYGK